MHIYVTVKKVNVSALLERLMKYIEDIYICMRVSKLNLAILFVLLLKMILIWRVPRPKERQFSNVMTFILFQHYEDYLSFF